MKSNVFTSTSEMELLHEIIQINGSSSFKRWLKSKNNLSINIPSYEAQGFNFIRKINSDFDDLAEDLLSKMLATNPLERWSCRELLNHPFFSDEDTN